jgi:methylmalonyl-CoA mutase, N-terminal domain
MVNEDVRRRMRAAREAWQKRVLEPFLGKSAERSESFVNQSGRKIHRVYTAEDAPKGSFAEAVGFPGEAPFTRGVQPTMYRGRLWTMRQYAGFATAAETNKRYKYLLEHGTTGLSVAFDLPTQIGLDADDAMAQGEVGRTGVAISSLLDMERLFDGIPLGEISTSMTINAPAAVLWAYYIAVGRKQGVKASALRGTIQNDILKEYIARGTYIFPPGPSMRLVADTFAYGAKEVPKWNTISVSGYHIREAGSTAVQELAFTLADGVAYVEAAKAAGLEVDEFAPRMSFFFNAHNDFFEEVAKFRAARRLWYRIMRDRFGAQDPASWTLRFHTQTGGSTLTAQSPENNIVRVALQALAATVGGTQSLHTNGFDEALALPTEKAARIALRTQQILAYETGVGNTVDPFGGSWFVESLTDELEDEAAKVIQKIDGMGGMLKAIEAGWPQKEIQEAAYRYQREVEAEERLVVGVNAFRDGQEAPAELLQIDEKLERAQVRALAKLRTSREKVRVEDALGRLESAARGRENLMPLILEAAEAYATTGEICNRLRGVFGLYQGSRVV